MRIWAEARIHRAIIIPEKSQAGNGSGKRGSGNQSKDRAPEWTKGTSKLGSDVKLLPAGRFNLL